MSYPETIAYLHSLIGQPISAYIGGSDSARSAAILSGVLGEPIDLGAVREQVSAPHADFEAGALMFCLDDADFAGFIVAPSTYDQAAFDDDGALLIQLRDGSSIVLDRGGFAPRNAG